MFVFNKDDTQHQHGHQQQYGTMIRIHTGYVWLTKAMPFAPLRSSVNTHKKQRKANNNKQSIAQKKTLKQQQGTHTHTHKSIYTYINYVEECPGDVVRRVDLP